MVGRSRLGFPPARVRELGELTLRCTVLPKGHATTVGGRHDRTEVAWVAAAWRFGPEEVALDRSSPGIGGAPFTRE